MYIECGVLKVCGVLKAYIECEVLNVFLRKAMQLYLVCMPTLISEKLPQEDIAISCDCMMFS